MSPTIQKRTLPYSAWRIPMLHWICSLTRWRRVMTSRVGAECGVALRELCPAAAVLHARPTVTRMSVVDVCINSRPTSAVRGSPPVALSATSHGAPPVRTRTKNTTHVNTWSTRVFWCCRKRHFFYSSSSSSFHSLIHKYNKHTNNSRHGQARSSACSMTHSHP